MNILILSPHADDAEIGAGGTISKLKSEGNNFLWVVFCPCKEPSNIFNKEDQMNEFDQVTDFFKIDKLVYDYPIRKLDLYRGKILDQLVNI